MNREAESRVEHLMSKNKQLREALGEAQQWLIGITDPHDLLPEDRECLERINDALIETQE